MYSNCYVDQSAITTGSLANTWSISIITSQHKLVDWLIEVTVLMDKTKTMMICKVVSVIREQISTTMSRSCTNLFRARLNLLMKLMMKLMMKLVVNLAKFTMTKNHLVIKLHFEVCY